MTININTITNDEGDTVTTNEEDRTVATIELDLRQLRYLRRLLSKNADDLLGKMTKWSPNVHQGVLDEYDATTEVMIEVDNALDEMVTALS